MCEELGSSLFQINFVLMQVVDHKLYGSRAEFDSTIDHVLEEFGVELVCLAGFMRILTGPFVRRWNGMKPHSGIGTSAWFKMGVKGTLLILLRNEDKNLYPLVHCLLMPLCSITSWSCSITSTFFACFKWTDYCICFAHQSKVVSEPLK